MPKDRLAEMKGPNGGNEMEELPMPTANYPMPSNDCGENNGSGQTSFSQLSHQTNKIQASLQETHDKVSQMRSLHETILSSPKSDPGKKEILEQLTETVIKEMSQVVKDLDAIKKTAAQDRMSQGLTSTENRIILSVHSSLTTKFKTVWEDLYSSRDDYEKRCRQRMERLMEIAGYTGTTKEMDEAIATGVQIFARDFAESESAKEALHDLQERHRELLKLEQGLGQLNALFLEVNLMIENQGGVADSVESRIVQAERDVEKGTERLAKENVKMGAARWIKFKCSAMFFIVTLVVIAVIALVLIFKKLV